MSPQQFLFLSTFILLILSLFVCYRSLHHSFPSISVSHTLSLSLSLSPPASRRILSPEFSLRILSLSPELSRHLSPDRSRWHLSPDRSRWLLSLACSLGCLSPVEECVLSTVAWGLSPE
uniref:Uncharacterized protein n=1 Tax=Cacopsylla melanoneura TaxID=428564 RepID=A0A8D8M3T6_9HEMI